MSFTGLVVLVGSLVCGLLVVFVWLGFTLGSGLRFGALGVEFGMFVLSHWFGVCFFLLFDSSLQGWGPAPVVGAVFFFLNYYCFLGHLTVFRPYTHEST
jgi:hypothetical protein